MLSLILLTAFSLMAGATEFTYTCTAHNAGQPLQLTLSQDERTAEVVSAPGAQGQPVNYIGDFDFSYHSKKGRRFRFIVRESGDDRTELILDEMLMYGGSPLENGAHGGYLRVQGFATGYWSWNFTCSDKP
jgi:hypothetical protein